MAGMSSLGPGDSAPDAAPTGDLPADDPLRLEHCPACGYALEGLAREGVCPECGVAYDQTEVVLHGYGAGVNMATSRPGWAIAMAATYSLIVVLGVHGWIRQGRRDSRDLFWPAVLAVCLAWSVWKRATGSMPGLVQVRLSARGAVQVNNPTPVRVKAGTVVPWRDVADVSIRPFGPGRVRIMLFGRKSFLKGAPVLVDADVQCGEREAHALEDRVKAWQAAARAAKSGGSSLRPGPGGAIIGALPEKAPHVVD